jgi:AcrR family transcriptional regulator
MPARVKTRPPKSPVPAEGSARERLLAAASQLFYEEGIHTVGIDRVIEHAGVAKASLYSAFGSKDELVRAYLSARQERRQRRFAERIAAAEPDGPRAQLLAIFDLQVEMVAEPGYRGCAFQRATADGIPDKKTRAVCTDSRAWLRGLFAELARAAGASKPDALAQQLCLLYDGAAVAAQVDRDPSAAKAARQVATGLVDAAIG